MLTKHEYYVVQRIDARLHLAGLVRFDELKRTYPTSRHYSPVDAYQKAVERFHRTSGAYSTEPAERLLRTDIDAMKALCVYTEVIPMKEPYIRKTVDRVVNGKVVKRGRPRKQ